MSVVDIYLKAHNEASAAIKAVDAELAKMGGGALNTSTILKTLGSAAVVGAVAKVGQMALDAVIGLDAMREESEQISARFVAQAGSTRSAADALSAMNAIVGTALTNDEKMAASGQLMALGLAQSSTEAANLANIAINLGDKTQGAAERIAGLTQVMVSGRLVGLKQYGISMTEVNALAADMQRESSTSTRRRVVRLSPKRKHSKKPGKITRTRSPIMSISATSRTSSPKASPRRASICKLILPIPWSSSPAWKPSYATSNKFAMISRAIPSGCSLRAAAGSARRRKWTR
jgi:hypothetical protein